MKNAFKEPKNIMVGSLLLIILLTAAAWQKDDNPKKGNAGKNDNYGDTSIPKQRNYDKNEFTVGDIDEAMKELNIQMKQLNEQMKNINIELSKSLQEAFSKADMEQLNKELQAEMKKVDFNKIQREINESMQEAKVELNKVDFEKIQEQVNKSMREAQQEIKKIDTEKIQREMQQLNNKINNGEFKKQIEEEMKNAREQMENASKELKQLKEFTDALQKDGLIDKNKKFTIEWKNGGELYINGQKQPKEISEKYKKYYKEDGYKIQMNAKENRGEAI